MGRIFFTPRYLGYCMQLDSQSFITISYAKKIGKKNSTNFQILQFDTIWTIYLEGQSSTCHHRVTISRARMSRRGAEISASVATCAYICRRISQFDNFWGSNWDKFWNFRFLPSDRTGGEDGVMGTEPMQGAVLHAHSKDTTAGTVLCFEKFANLWVNCEILENFGSEIFSSSLRVRRNKRRGGLISAQL